MECDWLQVMEKISPAVAAFVGIIAAVIKILKQSWFFDKRRQKEINQLEVVAENLPDLKPALISWQYELAMEAYTKRKLNGTQVKEAILMADSGLFARSELVVIAKYAGFGSLGRLPLSWSAIIEAFLLVLILIPVVVFLGTATLGSASTWWGPIVLVALSFALWFGALLFARDGVRYLINLKRWRERVNGVDGLVRVPG